MTSGGYVSQETPFFHTLVQKFENSSEKDKKIIHSKLKHSEQSHF